MDNLAKALGERIRAQRKICRISQDALALACSLDRSYMGRIERGERVPNLVAIIKIADALGCSASELIGRFEIHKTAASQAEMLRQSV